MEARKMLAPPAVPIKPLRPVPSPITVSKPQPHILPVSLSSSSKPLPKPPPPFLPPRPQSLGKTNNSSSTTTTTTPLTRFTTRYSGRNSRVESMESDLSDFDGAWLNTETEDDFNQNSPKSPFPPVVGSMSTPMQSHGILTSSGRRTPPPLPPTTQSCPESENDFNSEDNITAESSSSEGEEEA